MAYEINLNDVVEVTLTDKGLQLYKDNVESLTIPNQYKYYLYDNLHTSNEGIILRIQLWELMNIFGDHLYNGCEIPFKDNIIRCKIISTNGDKNESSN